MIGWRLLVALVAAGLAVATGVLLSGDSDWEDYPATCSFQSGVKKCTCVLVGPDVLLTAEHCTTAPSGDENDRETIAARTGEVTFFTELTRAAQCIVSSDLDLAGLDLAICRLNEEVEDIAFENLNEEPLEVGRRLVLTGFGCKSELDAHSQDRTFNVDEDARIESTDDSAGLRFHIEDGDLCSGDSGGPGYALLSDDPSGPRRVAGINVSNFQLTSVTTDEARDFFDFFEDWAEDHGGAVSICGLTEGAQGCRSLSPPS